jgi:hypothetical protein
LNAVLCNPQLSAEQLIVTRHIKLDPGYQSGRSPFTFLA